MYGAAMVSQWSFECWCYMMKVGNLVNVYWLLLLLHVIFPDPKRFFDFLYARIRDIMLMS